MFQNYELLFIVGTLGTIISFCILLISMAKGIKGLRILSGILICIFVMTFSGGIALGYNNYEKTKKNVKATDKVEEIPKVTSGAITDPIVITEKSFTEDDSYYYSEFEIRNNTSLEISKISYHIAFTDKFTQAGLAHDEHLFLLDSVIPPKKTVVKNYIRKKYYDNKKTGSSNPKLAKIQDIVCYVNVNGQEQTFKLDDLKALGNNIK
ncbi:hypothetical protein [Clostridium sp. YIM B02555]|uniref:hypothetical protein n=1 Tax=Clostridium sp. YIM B02555 TaxID=2911968 RepID=UPI001EEEC817|nr:hypothetical protein [Clostridium sp. YIM B02555]